VTTTHQHSESILAEVARQERELLEKLERVKEEARTRVDQARAEAIKLQQDEEARTQAEIASMRREAEQARRRAFDETVAQAEAHLRERRDAAMGRVPEVAESVLGYFMPNGSRG